MAYTAEHLRSRADRRLVDFDPGGTDPVIVDLDPTSSGELLPLSDGYRRFLAGLFRSVGTGDIDAFEIIVGTDADGTGATVVASHAFGAGDADAVGDYVWLECDVETAKNALATATHIGVRIEMAADEECVVYFERADGQFQHTNQTADYISS